MKRLLSWILVIIMLLSVFPLTELVSFAKSDGWVKEHGYWIYYENGEAVSNKWKKIDGYWYYFAFRGSGNSGAVSGVYGIDEGDNTVYYYFDKSCKWREDKNGWAKDELVLGNHTKVFWYYFKNGKGYNGWKKSDGYWYYFNYGWMYDDVYIVYEKGIPTRYIFDSNGHWLDYYTGWESRISNGKTLYFYFENGIGLKGWQRIDGKWYYLNEYSTAQTGWQKIGGKWYYFRAEGDMKTGWMQKGNKWYYFDKSGVMQTGSVKINGKTYKFDSNGVCQNP